MDVKAAFNEQYKATMANAYVLDTTFYSPTLGHIYQTFDFMARTLISGRSSSSAGFTVTPFSQLDRDVLITMRDKLVELGGSPPDLAPEAPALNKPVRGLNP
ncbi:MAG: hypothetical protein JNM12_04115 [Alphaproteobacteria bacterium]|nr:hypothetical protein [Alphaproteobacteria bacterium]